MFHKYSKCLMKGREKKHTTLFDILMGATRLLAMVIQCENRAQNTYYGKFQFGKAQQSRWEENLSLFRNEMRKKQCQDDGYVHANVFVYTNVCVALFLALHLHVLPSVQARMCACGCEHERK